MSWPVRDSPWAKNIAISGIIFVDFALEKSNELTDQQDMFFNMT